MPTKERLCVGSEEIVLLHRYYFACNPRQANKRFLTPNLVFLELGTILGQTVPCPEQERVVLVKEMLF